MARKIAFISSVHIGLSKSFEERLNLDVDGVSVRYEHPVLYLTKETKRDKDYIYILSSRPTYVLLKVKLGNLNHFLNAIKHALSMVGMNSSNIDKFVAEIAMYCRLADILRGMHQKVLNRAREEIFDELYILNHFDPLLRRRMLRWFVREKTFSVLWSTARDIYFLLPDEIRAAIPLLKWLKIVRSELNWKSITRTILKEIFTISSRRA